MAEAPTSPSAHASALPEPLAVAEAQRMAPFQQVPVHPRNYSDNYGFQLDLHLQKQETYIPVMWTTSVEDSFPVKEILFETIKVKVLRIKAKDRDHPDTVMKMGKFTNSEEHRQRRFLTEMAVHRYASRGCPYIAEIHNTLYLFQRNSCYGFQMEYLSDGALQIATLERYSYSERVGICTDVAKGLKHIHSLRLVHGDIKLDNIVVSVRPDLKYVGKIIDFG
eukprot:scpid102461/ scgid28274/ 